MCVCVYVCVRVRFKSMLISRASTSKIYLSLLIGVSHEKVI